MEIQKVVASTVAVSTGGGVRRGPVRRLCLEGDCVRLLGASVQREQRDTHGSADPAERYGGVHETIQRDGASLSSFTCGLWQ